MTPGIHRSLIATLALAVLWLGPLFASPALAQFTPPPNTIGLTIEGCNNGGNTPITPSGTLPNTDGRFVCQDPAPLGGNDNPYTTGNLGKDWSELDLVPHRLILTNSGAATTYNVQIAADYENNGILGYDVITQPEIIPAGALNGFSDAGCMVAFTADTTVPDVTGGAGQSIFRTLTITHPVNSTCVVDFAIRLAVGASGFPGASLQSYKFESEDFQQGKATISLPVNEIEPQTLEKDMTATQSTDFAWNITKGPNPATLSFGDTCNPGNDLEEELTIRVDWKILDGMPGMVMVVTNIYATNPASRAITVDVTDEIFGDLGGGKVSLDVFDCDPVDVPADTMQLVCTHVFDAATDVTDLMDTATASYTDQATGVPVPGQSEAMASASIQQGTDTNTTAVISDSEELTGNGLSFTLDSTSGAAVDCGGILPIGPTTGPVVCATADPQLGDGFVLFNKTVSLDEPRITSGTLSDKADLTGSDGFTADASASVAISSTATVELTINKTIPDILQGADTISCNFAITGPNSFSDSAVLAFTAGETSESATLTDLEPGMYTVTEGSCGGLVPVGGNEQTVDIALPACAGEVSFQNAIPVDQLATAQAEKVTLPIGEEAGWEFTLSGPGGPISRETTGAGFEPFLDGLLNPFALQEGDYTITEVVKDGWDQTMVSAGCSFSVDYPADLGKTFSCTIENTQRGEIIVKKVTDPVSAPGSFVFSGALNGSIGDGGMLMSGLIAPGSYSVVEADPAPDFDLVDVDCDDDTSVNASVGDVPTRTASFELDPGETVTCTFTNRQRGMVTVLKTVFDQVDPNQSIVFDLTGPGVNATDNTLGDRDGILDFDMAKLTPGETYTVCEEVPAAWSSFWMFQGQIVSPYNPDAPTQDLGVRCYDFAVEAGQTVSFEIDNEFPGGDARTPGYWKNWNRCTGGGQAANADRNGGPAEGFFLLEDVLPQLIGDLEVDTCEEGVAILDSRDLVRGKKRSNDAAYALARNLLAAKLNFAAGAGTCSLAQTAAMEGQTLLDDIGFDGTGSYLKPKPRRPLLSVALQLAHDLDEYNNNRLCP